MTPAAPKPDELAQLDLAVARAEGIDCIRVENLRGEVTATFGSNYQPTRDGAEAMRLLEKYGISLLHGALGSWEAAKNGKYGSGPTPAIAICRAVVALKEKP